MSHHSRVSRARTRLLTSLLAAVCITVMALGATSAGAFSHTRSASSDHHAAKFRATAARVVPSSLRAAAARTTRDDRALVTRAKALKACLHSYAAQPSRCRSDRRSVQSAGSTLARARKALAAIARGGAARTASAGASRVAAANPRLAPELSVSGETLTWTRVDEMSTYVLVRKVPGEPAEYSLLSGSTVTPPAVPGVTVRYSVRTTTRGSAWSAEQAISYPAASKAPEPIAMQAAPHLIVSGDTVEWSSVSGVSTYVLVRRVPGQADEYSVVSGTSVTPAAVPGKTVSFSIRTAVDGSAWAPEVTISYPAVSTPVPPPVTPPTPPVTEAPAPASNITFQPGINSGSSTTFDIPGSLELGAKIVRLNWGIEATPKELEPVIAEYAAAGIRVAPLAVFDGRIPSPSEAANLASWAKTFGPGGTFWAGKSDGQLAIQSIEFGNETSYGYQYPNNTAAGYASRAQEYAIRFAESAEAIKAVNPGVGLLAQGDSGNAGSIWIENMFKAVPNLGQLVGGWTIHPYGPGFRPRLEALVKETAAQGAPSTIPIDITEWGLSTDNGDCVTENYGWNTCMTYQEAAEVLTKSANEMRQILNGRLGLFLVYAVRDQQPAGTNNEREAYFGALQHETQPKGAYTEAIKALMSS